MEWANNPKSEGPRREAAVSALVDLGGQKSMEQLEQLAAGNHSYEMRQRAIVGLIRLDVHKAARCAGELMRQSPPAGHDPGELFTAFLQRKEGSQALAKVLHQEKPATDTARVGLRVLVELGTPALELQAALQTVLGKTEVKRKLDATEIKRWISRVQSQGDPARGEIVFRRSTLGCLQCHALGGAGGRVGPDLSGIGTSAQLDYLIESVFLPSKVVREGYTTAHVTTKDGRIFSGILQRENAKEIVLKDAVRDEIIIAIQDVEEKRVGGSLMPDGLDQSLTDAELTDLFSFLAELGKPGPFAITHLAVPRRWQYLAVPAVALQAQDDAVLGKLLHEENTFSWKPVYTRVSGHLPLSETLTAPAQQAALVRFQLEVVTPGKVALHVNDIQGVAIWVDGDLIAAQQNLSLELKRGLHTFLFRVDVGARTTPLLRCELMEAAGSKAQVKIVDGR